MDGTRSTRLLFASVTSSLLTGCAYVMPDHPTKGYEEYESDRYACEQWTQGEEVEVEECLEEQGWEDSWWKS